MKRLTSNYDPRRRGYNYRLSDAYTTHTFLSMASEVVDEAIDQMLLERLRATTIDETAWREAVERAQRGEYLEVRRVEQAIRNAERSRDHIFDNLKTVSHPELVKNLEASYIANESEIAQLRQQLEDMQAPDQFKRMLLEAKPVMDLVIANWTAVPREKRRELFEAFAHRAMITRLDLIRRRVTVQWRDDSQTARTVQTTNVYFSWTPDELHKLKQMVENHEDQVEILRAFPGVPWGCLQQRYAYHFGGRRWFADYRGKRRHNLRTRWEYTEEFLREQSSRIDANMVVSTTAELKFSKPAACNHTFRTKGEPQRLVG
jgi:hypothetical protein